MVSVSTVPPGGGTTFLTQTVGPWSPAPAVSFGGATTGITYGASTAANFVKTGKQVTVTGYVVFTSKGSATGQARLINLPYPVAVAGGVSVVLGIHSLIGFTGPVFLDLSGTEGFFYLPNATAITDANFTNVSFFEFSFVYVTT